MKGSELKTQIKKATQFSQCIFHDTNECSSKIINGHSISKSKILDTLSQDAFVYIPEIDFDSQPNFNRKPKTFMDLIAPKLGLPNIKISRITKKNCSTSKVFCAKHDQSLFSIIDQTAFEDTIDQIFQYSYRAFSKEYSAVIKEKKLYESFPIHKKIDVSLIDLKVSDIENSKQKFDDAYLKKEFDIFESFYHKLPYEVNLAVSTCYNPPMDFEGNKLVNLYSRDEKRTPQIFLNVFPENGKTVILFSFFRDDKRLFKNYFNQLEKISKNKNNFRRVLNHILVTYPENIVFGEKLNQYMTKTKKWDYYKSDFMEFSYLPSIRFGELGDMSDLMYSEQQKRKLEYNLLQNYI
ncbi:hypothetical protein [Pseudolactococcus carnosus]|uniref:hypothetical protein n=1 Tax=Pseudolactococcus carnosus TaxID=2749961 RepID=UPI001FB9258F|nr:hypothetical protein [Lactococcus carnosus]MCJ1971183.1 hypothetical protein [Lactococcus carnosus]MCJ2001221.1 hypothetical protein [Lactococcus carnosus]